MSCVQLHGSQPWACKCSVQQCPIVLGGAEAPEGRQIVGHRSCTSCCLNCLTHAAACPWGTQWHSNVSACCSLPAGTSALHSLTSLCVAATCSIFPPAGTLTQNDMKVVRLWTAGTDHKNIAQLPVLGVPKFRNSTEVTGNPGTGSLLDVGSMIKPDAPLGLHPDVLSLLVTGIAVNSNANLRLDSSPSGGHSAQCWQCRCVLFTEVLLLHK